MKYWNKNPHARSHWTRLIHNIKGSNVEFMRYFEIEKALQQRKIWCQRQESNSRFFYEYGENGSRVFAFKASITHYESTWWFEDPKDATLFLVQWSS